MNRLMTLSLTAKLMNYLSDPQPLFDSPHRLLASNKIDGGEVNASRRDLLSSSAVH